MTHCWYDKQTKRVVGPEKCFRGGTFQSACPAVQQHATPHTRHNIPSPFAKSTVQTVGKAKSGDPFFVVC